MIKIKDNVNLKDLEKYGFELNHILDKKAYKREQVYVALWYGSKRKIYLGKYTDNNDLEILFDLIQAGLIEKK